MTKTHFEQVPLDAIKTIVEQQITEESSAKSVAANLDAKKAVRSGRKANA